MAWVKYLLLHLALLSLLSFISKGEDVVMVVDNIQPVIASVNATGRLNCTVKRDSDSSVYFLRRDQSVVFSKDDAITLEDKLNPIVADGKHKYEIVTQTNEDDGTEIFQFVINALQIADEGEYTCRLDNPSVRLRIEKPGYVIVHHKPSIIASETSQKLTVQKSDEATLICKATGKPDPMIKWSRPYTTQDFPEPFTGVYEVSGSEITFTKVAVEDMGTYRCTAENSEGRESVDVVSAVESAPVVESTRVEFKGRIGGTAILACTIRGYPDPDISWSKLKDNGTSIYVLFNDDDYDDEDNNNKGRFSTTTIRNDSMGDAAANPEFEFRLEIVELAEEDLGEYDCWAVNERGSDFLQVTLTECEEEDEDEACHVTTDSAVVTQSYRIVGLIVAALGSIYFL